VVFCDGCCSTIATPLTVPAESPVRRGHLDRLLTPAARNGHSDRVPGGPETLAANALEHDAPIAVADRARQLVGHLLEEPRPYVADAHAGAIDEGFVGDDGLAVHPRAVTTVVVGQHVPAAVGALDAGVVAADGGVRHHEIVAALAADRVNARHLECPDLAEVDKENAQGSRSLIVCGTGVGGRFAY
jgi:hypothetical protein